MAKFEKGNKIATGRPVGSLNRRSVAFFETIQTEGFDPAKAILDIFNEAKSDLSISDKPEERAAFMKIALDAAKEIASYCFPKLKSVEHVKTNALEGMSPSQRLEAMKQAVKMLEGEISKDVRQIDEVKE